ncbi:MAG: hypothetical protein CL405_02120 [Acidimicrobiaceae bacterium]|nr:hypothetical protein [Acidimicrobiaceae bacterium]
MIEMQVVGVQVVLPSNAPVVLLRESEGRRLLPIFIGDPEATAIAVALAGRETPRPMTHDLVVEVLDGFSIRLEQVVVSELRDRTFFAELHLRGPDGPQVVSARPSDAIALAVRTATSVFAAEEVLEEAGYLTPEEEKPVGTEEQLEEFREFLDQVNPEDFAGE